MQFQLGKQRKFLYTVAWGRLCPKEMVYQVPINLGGHIFPTTMIILKDQDIDVILRMNWMYQHRAVIDVLNRTLRVSLPDSNS